MTEFQHLHVKWLKKDPAYAAEYLAMEPEFAIAREQIRVRAAAGMTEADVAERTAQARQRTLQRPAEGGWRTRLTETRW